MPLIRPALLEDTPLIAAFLLESFAHCFAENEAKEFHGYYKEHLSPEALCFRLRHKNQAILYQYHGMPTGYLEWHGSHIQLFCVRKSMQQQGIGYRLLSEYNTLHPAPRVTINIPIDSQHPFEALGFMPLTKTFLLNDIPHIKMVYAAKQIDHEATRNISS